MSVPYLSKDDVTAWIEAKNKTTSTPTSKITATTSKTMGIVSTLLGKSIELTTKEGPIYVSKQALAYLSESEKKLSDKPEEQLSLRILAETKLTPLVIQSHDAIPLLPEQRKPLETFLRMFNVHIKGDAAHTSIHRDSLIRASQETPSELGVSTPEFVMNLVHTFSSKPSASLHRTEETHTALAVLDQDKAHAIIADFALHPQKNQIPELVHAFLSVPADHDPLALRKWARKICHHIADDSERKVHIFNDLLIEYERQSRTATKKVDNCLPFQTLVETIFEELFGPKDHAGKRYYLTSALALSSIGKKTNIKTALSAPMKEAIRFYSLIQENPYKDARGGGIEQERLLLENAYKEEGKPNLSEAVQQLWQAIR